MPTLTYTFYGLKYQYPGSKKKNSLSERPAPSERTPVPITLYWGMNSTSPCLAVASKLGPFGKSVSRVPWGRARGAGKPFSSVFVGGLAWVGPPPYNDAESIQ